MHRDSSPLPVKFRTRDAKHITGVSGQTLDRYEKKFDDFPKPSRPTPRVKLHDTERVLAWLDKHSGDVGAEADT